MVSYFFLNIKQNNSNRKHHTGEIIWVFTEYLVSKFYAGDSYTNNGIISRTSTVIRSVN